MNPSRPQQFNLTKEQLDTVGPPNAGANSKNAGGYSVNQVKKMRWLEAHDNTPVMSRDRDFSSWGNPSEPAYTTPQDKLNI